MASHSSGERRFERQYDWTMTDPSVAIVETLAAKNDVEPTATGFTLADSVDPDSLDRLVRDVPDVTMSLTVDGERVLIDGDTVSVGADTPGHDLGRGTGSNVTD